MSLRTEDGAVAAHARDVFISYASEDEAAADVVCRTLEARGLSCWMAPRDIIPGQDWASVILDAIEAATALVLVLSASSNASPQVKREVERAAHANIPIIPFRIEDVEPARSLEFFISTPHWSDAFTPGLEAHAAALAEDLKRLFAGAGRPPPTALLRSAPAQRRSPVLLLSLSAVAGAVAILALIAARAGLFDGAAEESPAQTAGRIAASQTASGSTAGQGHPFVRTPPDERGRSDDQITTEPDTGP